MDATKDTTNRAIARADALGDEALTKVANTSLDLTPDSFVTRTKLIHDHAGAK